MIELSEKIQSYYVTSSDLLLNTLKELLIHSNITYVALSTVFIIIVTLSSLIVLFKKKRDEVFSFPEEFLPEPVNHDIDVIHCNEGESKVLNYKQLLLQLHYVTSKCYDSCYASKCIRLVRDCPYLINVALEPGGLTPFQRVCYHSHTCLVEYMLAKGANPWLTTQAGENALCLAVYYHIKHPSNNDLSCLDVLFQSGCTLDPKSRCFEIILKRATKVCHKRLTEWILVHTNTHPSDQRSISVPPAFRYLKGYSQYKPSLNR
ncbi:uncharacterized protein LOC105686575 [Athalia rosae]|uniref:uncharacterized protein LOC105686575 n=1 Tax=Athalia rosae TaxID=37344 RepID=UPI0020335AC9|nr:uncharacterized protein LOC105686575 [Athalia rosae]